MFVLKRISINTNVKYLFDFYEHFTHKIQESITKPVVLFTVITPTDNLDNDSLLSKKTRGNNTSERE